MVEKVGVFVCKNLVEIVLLGFLLSALLQVFLKIPVTTMVAGDYIDENVVSLACYRHNRVSVIVLWKLVNE